MYLSLTIYFINAFNWQLACIAQINLCGVYIFKKTCWDRPGRFSLYFFRGANASNQASSLIMFWSNSRFCCLFRCACGSAPCCRFEYMNWFSLSSSRLRFFSWMYSREPLFSRRCLLSRIRYLIWLICSEVSLTSWI